MAYDYRATLAALFRPLAIHIAPILLSVYGIICVVGRHAYLLGPGRRGPLLVQVADHAAALSGVGYIALAFAIYSVIDSRWFESAFWYWRFTKRAVGLLCFGITLMCWLAAYHSGYEVVIR